MIRGKLWTAQVFAVSTPAGTPQNLPTALLDRLHLVACQPPWLIQLLAFLPSLVVISGPAPPPPSAQFAVR